MLDWIGITVLTLALLICWVGIPLRAVQHARKLKELPPVREDVAAAWPLVSVLVPARNEADTLDAAVASLLALDYPALEIILIDDRSDDGTGAVVDRLARRDRRVRALHLDRLPDGWLGKVHALHRGLEQCRGEWLLFTDADIHFAPATLKRALTHGLARDKDLVSLLPAFSRAGLLVGAAQSALGTLLLAMMDFERIADRRRPDAMGVGAFNLVRRSCLDTREGLEWLRLEVADDAGLALMVKSRGADIELLSGRGLIEVAWYPTLRAMLDGVLQRTLLGARYSLGLYLLQCLFTMLCLAAPALLALVLAPAGPAAWALLAAYALPSLILGLGPGRLQMPLGWLCLLPLGALIIGYGMLRTAFTVLWRGGLYWRGQVYPMAELRAAQRFRPPSLLRRGGEPGG